MLQIILILNLVSVLFAQNFQCDKNRRNDCGYFGVQQAECESNGCCWDTSGGDGSPYCFYKSATQCDVTGDRQDCGYIGIDADGCQNAGCCWAPSGDHSDIPWCYHPNTPTLQPSQIPTFSPGEVPFTDAEYNKMKTYFFQNIDISNTGCILASPSTSEPDYYYHWMRDAAITMNIVLQLGGIFGAHDGVVNNYVNWVNKVQNARDPNGVNVLGEPKFFVEGSVYDGSWGRPQNDGPGLRSLVLSRYGDRKLNMSESDQAYVRNTLFPSIEKDLDYVCSVYTESSFDLWEEVNGYHFFTRMVQRNGLLTGAKLATRLGADDKASTWAGCAKVLSGMIDQHWNPNTGIIEFAVNRDESNHYRYHEIDVAVLLGSLYGDAGDGFYDVHEEKVMSTVEAMIDVFTDGSYGIQTQEEAAGIPGVYIGRYPNDTYSGTSTSGQGNPWILATAALGEYYYRHAVAVKEGKVTPAMYKHYQNLLGKRVTHSNLLASLVQQGDHQLNKIRLHVARDFDFHLSEQLNRYSGKPQGANDLTWSYGATIAAMEFRTQVVN